HRCKSSGDPVVSSARGVGTSRADAGACRTPSYFRRARTGRIEPSCSNRRLPTSLRFRHGGGEPIFSLCGGLAHGARSGATHTVILDAPISGALYDTNEESSHTFSEVQAGEPPQAPTTRRLPDRDPWRARAGCSVAHRAEQGAHRFGRHLPRGG